MGVNQAPLTPADLESERYRYYRTTRLGSGDLSEIIEASACPINGEGESAVIIKVALDPEFNDLVHNEAVILDDLRRKAANIPGTEQFLPRLLDTFIYRGHRNVNVIERAEGYYTLEEIREAYPEGLPPQAAGWMGNRLFECLSMMTVNGVVHGAILPPHVMFHFGDQDDPIRHTMQLIDWTLALQRDPSTGVWPKRAGRIERYADFYPPEKAVEVTPATDLAMAAACLQYVMGGDVKTGTLSNHEVPPGMKFLLQTCRHPQPDSRPNVMRFREQFRAMLDRHFGAGRFHYTPMPRG